MKNISSTSAIFLGIAVVLAVLIGAAVWQNVKPTGLDDFAKCLSDNGAVMYGAWWCPHCEDQKDDFGPSFRHVNYVECGAARGQFNTAACPDIQSTPTWTDADGNEYKGRQDLGRLGEVYGCQLP